YERGFRFGQLAYDLVAKQASMAARAVVYLVFGHMIYPWSRHPEGALDILRQAFEAAHNVGNLPHACYALRSIGTLLIGLGRRLDEAREEVERALAFAHKFRFGLV